MDVFRAVLGTLGCINNLFAQLQKSTDLGKSLGRGLKSVKNDFEMMSNLRPIQGKQLLLQPPGMQLLLQELACDIDDFIQDLWVPGPCGAFVLSATGMDPRPELIERTKEFRERIKTLSKELKSSEPTTSAGCATATPAGCRPDAGSPGYTYTPEKDLVGIAKPKREILDLLSPGDGTLKVISIVGCSGLGKTALARAVYEDQDVGNKFDYKSWVVASDASPDDIVENIGQELLPAAPPRRTIFGALQKIRQKLHLPAPGFSNEKRYLVFIDDVQQGGIKWDLLENVFHENNKGSRIILTTSVRSIAAARSSGSYMYTMKCLGENDSADLFWRKAKRYIGEPSKNLVNSSEDIILKCGGLPLALISAGQFLSKIGQGLERADCEDVSKELGGYLIGEEDAFVKMKRSLVQCYDNLHNHNHMNCLLYTSIFPRGHRINNKNLVRKIMAEKLVSFENKVPEELVAKDIHKCLDELIDKSIIEKVLFSNNSKVAVEMWKVHSIMLEFIIKKALSTNFLSLIHEDKLQKNTSGHVRRLTVQSTSPEGYNGIENIELSHLRSLTVFPTGKLDFRSCRMMRVLDLEGCNFHNDNAKDICELVFLKFLNLRKTGITALPKAVENLKCLETLDLRETGVETLPLQVIMLPRLELLFGNFEVPRLGKVDREILEKFLQNESKLHTLAGIIINGTQDFETIIKHARRLEKVKVWFKVTTSSAVIKSSHKNKVSHIKHPFKLKIPALHGRGKSSGSKLEKTDRLADILVSSLQHRFQKLNCVSIDFNGLCNDFLGYCLQDLCNNTISTIKLHGNLERLPQPDMLRQLRNLRKLHLFSTSLSIEDLAVLQNLEYLEYLKLAEDKSGSWKGKFVVAYNGFPSLHLLCFEAPRLPKVVFHQGSMASLNSLQLLCPISLSKVEDISHLSKLSEVILHHSAHDATVKAWKDAAKLHANKPYVKKQP